MGPMAPARWSRSRGMEMTRFNPAPNGTGALTLVVGLMLMVSTCLGQTSVAVPRKAEGAYWLVKPKPWFTRLLTLSIGNRELPKDDHDASLPTIPGYYHRTKEGLPFVRYPFVSVTIHRRSAVFTTKTVRGLRFVFRGVWGTEDDKSSGIEDVPFLKGTLLTYRHGKLIRQERVEFSHAVNA